MWGGAHTRVMEGEKMGFMGTSKMLRVWLSCVFVSAAAWVLLPASRAAAQEPVTREALRQALTDLRTKVQKAGDAGHQTLYAEVPLTVGTKFVEKDWDSGKIAEMRGDWAAYLMRQARYESSQLDAMLAGKGNPRKVPPIPDYAELVRKDNTFTVKGKPVLIVTTRNSGGQPGDVRYAGPGDLYAWDLPAQGATRWDYKNWPIWELYQNDPKSHRVYDRGWCGHIIKDKWSLGGQQGECIISLDYAPMREAIRKTLTLKAERFRKSARFKRAKVLAAYWEFTYQNYDEPSRIKWQQWLKRRYGAIGRLNAIWKTKLKGFEDVTLPSVYWNRERNPAKYYDFGEFNLWRFTDYLKWSTDLIRKLCPGWPIMTGGGQPFGRGFAKQGLDEEYLRARGVVDVFLSETGSRSWGTASFVDLQRSIDPNVMIMDPEYHSTGGFMPLMFFHGMASIDFYSWNSAGVGRSLPDGIATLRGCLDARRLAGAIVEFPKAVPQAAILYSRASLIQRYPGITTRGVDNPFTLELQKCYRAGTVLDTPMGFVTSRQLREGLVRRELKVILVPGAYFTAEAVFGKILDFARRGGTVVILPTSFVADEYNRRRDYLREIGVEITTEVVPKFLARKAEPGVALPGSEYDFIQGPIAQTVVQDEPTATITWKARGATPGQTLAGRGIRQAIKVSGRHTVLAAFDDGSPAVFSRRHGRGEILYVAMQLEQASVADLLDWVYDRAGVKRPVRVKDPDGKTIAGLESRTVPYRAGYLTYLYNMTEKTVTARLQPTMRLSRIEDLTYAATAKPADSFQVGPYDWYVLRLVR